MGAGATRSLQRGRARPTAEKVVWDSRCIREGGGRRGPGFSGSHGTESGIPSTCYELHSRVGPTPRRGYGEPAANRCLPAFEPGGAGRRNGAAGDRGGREGPSRGLGEP